MAVAEVHSAEEGWKMATKIWQKNLDVILYKHQDKILNNYKGENRGKLVGERSLPGTGLQAMDKNPCPTCPREWDWLREFKCPEYLQNELTNRDMWIQRIENGQDNINLDIYQIEIRQLPFIGYYKNNEYIVTSEQHTMYSFFEHFRKNLNNFREGAFSSFGGGITDNDNEKWLSNNPLGAVCQFNGLLLPAIGNNFLNLDDASVVCSNYWGNQNTHELGWIFSTLRTRWYDRKHPVSGHRAFYIKRIIKSGKTYYILSIRGADRLTTKADNLVGERAFESADGFWEEIRSGILEYLANNNANHGLTIKR